jgi:hypothetical protein
MDIEFVVYVDEAGDEGFKFLDGERGSSRWFVLSATIIRKSNDRQLVELGRAARKLLQKPEKYVFHFRELKHEQRVPLVRLISEAPVRTVNIMVHKPSIRHPETFQQEAHKLYRYCSRLLLERVSWLCRDHTNGRTCAADLIFSNRSAMSYDDLRNYLDLLRRQSALNPDVSIYWPAISCENVRAVNHDQLAGLQVADAVASSMFFAANKTLYGEVEDRYFRSLRPTFFRNDSQAVGYGIKIWCDDETQIKRLAGLASLQK